MAELKPCPFCGRKPSKVREHYVPGTALIYYSVECKSPMSRCMVRPTTVWLKTEEEAAEAWNRRVSDG